MRVERTALDQPLPAPDHYGFSPKDLSWMLMNAPSETLVLRPAPEEAAGDEASITMPSQSRASGRA
jgi:hypothetical protein